MVLPFTWYNKRYSGAGNLVRLDRALANQASVKLYKKGWTSIISSNHEPMFFYIE